MKKKIFTTALLSSLSVLALVSCGKEDTVALTSASGEKVTIKTTSNEDDVYNALSALKAQTYETKTTAVGIKASLDAKSKVTDVATKVVKQNTTMSLDADVRVGIERVGADDKEYASTYEMMADMDLYADLTYSQKSTFVYDVTTPKEKSTSSMNVSAKAYSGTVKGKSILGIESDYSGLFVVPTKISMKNNGEESAMTSEAQQLIKNRMAINAQYEMLPESYASMGLGFVAMYDEANVASLLADTEEAKIKGAISAYGIKISNISGNNITFKASFNDKTLNPEASATADVTVELTVNAKNGMFTKVSYSEKNYVSADETVSYSGTSIKFSASISYNSSVSFPTLKAGKTMIDASMIMGSFMPAQKASANVMK